MVSGTLLDPAPARRVWHDEVMVHRAAPPASPHRASAGCVVLLFRILRNSALRAPPLAAARAGPAKCTYFPGTKEASPHHHYRP